MSGDTSFKAGSHASSHHETAWIEAGRADGPLMIFLHGWPEIGLIWRAQLEHFAAAGWRCVAPDMRGYGGSSVPTAISDYSVRMIVDDMVALHDALGGEPAVWVGHDWGSPVAWSLAAHHPARCRGVANLCVPYLARGMTLETLVPLVDRTVYPEDRFPVGQWDYWRYHYENYARSAAELAADVPATLAVLYRAGSPDGLDQPARLANIRAQGGWFGDAHRAPATRLDTTILSEADYALFIAAFERTGFSGANAWYLNDAANAAFASEAPDFGRITVPALFIHARWDTTCETVRSQLADPMRADCAELTEVTIDAGHEVMKERPAETNAALANWLAKKVSTQRSSDVNLGLPRSHF